MGASGPRLEATTQLEAVGALHTITRRRGPRCSTFDWNVSKQSFGGALLNGALVLAFLLPSIQPATAVTWYPHKNCTRPDARASCDGANHTCRYCRDEWDHCPSGTLQDEEAWDAEDMSDCLTTGCHVGGCPSGYKQINQTRCVEFHLDCLGVCYDETCCRLRPQMSCCEELACTAVYDGCRVAQQHFVTDPSRSQIDYTLIAHTGDAKFPFYAARHVAPGAACTPVFGLCVCADGVMLPGCDPNNSSTWYDWSADVDTLGANVTLAEAEAAAAAAVAAAAAASTATSGANATASANATATAGGAASTNASATANATAAAGDGTSPMAPPPLPSPAPPPLHTLRLLPPNLYLQCDTLAPPAPPPSPDGAAAGDGGGGGGNGNATDGQQQQRTQGQGQGQAGDGAAGPPASPAPPPAPAQQKQQLRRKHSSGGIVAAVVIGSIVLAGVIACTVLWCCGMLPDLHRLRIRSLTSYEPVFTGQQYSPGLDTRSSSATAAAVADIPWTRFLGAVREGFRRLRYGRRYRQEAADAAAAAERYRALNSLQGRAPRRSSVDAAAVSMSYISGSGAGGVVGIGGKMPPAHMHQPQPPPASSSGGGAAGLTATYGPYDTDDEEYDDVLGASEVFTLADLGARGADAGAGAGAGGIRRGFGFRPRVGDRATAAAIASGLPVSVHASGGEGSYLASATPAGAAAGARLQHTAGAAAAVRRHRLNQFGDDDGGGDGGAHDVIHTRPLVLSDDDRGGGGGGARRRGTHGGSGEEDDDSDDDDLDAPLVLLPTPQVTGQTVTRRGGAPL